MGDVKDAPVDGVGGEEDGDAEEHEEGEIAHVDGSQVAHALPALVHVDTETCGRDGAVQHRGDGPDQHETDHVHLHGSVPILMMLYNSNQHKPFLKKPQRWTQKGRSHQLQEEQTLRQLAFNTNKNVF